MNKKFLAFAFIALVLAISCILVMVFVVGQGMQIPDMAMGLSKDEANLLNITVNTDPQSDPYRIMRIMDLLIPALYCSVLVFLYFSLQLKRIRILFVFPALSFLSDEIENIILFLSTGNFSDLEYEILGLVGLTKFLFWILGFLAYILALIVQIKGRGFRKA